MAIDLTRIGKLHVGLVGATGSVAYATHWMEPGSVVLGGVVMGANFYLLRWIAGFLRPGALDPAKRGRVALAIVAFVLKFGLFLVLLGALFWRVPVEGMSFACGVTLLLVACLIEVGHSDSRMRKGAG